MRQVGLVSLYLALFEPSEANAAFCAKRETSVKRETRGGEKESACDQSIVLVLALPPTYTHKYGLTAVMSKGPVKTRSITQKLSPFWLPETPTTA